MKEVISRRNSVRYPFLLAAAFALLLGVSCSAPVDNPPDTKVDSAKEPADKPATGAPLANKSEPEEAIEALPADTEPPELVESESPPKNLTPEECWTRNS